MSDLLVLIVYLAGFVITAPLLARAILRSAEEDFPTLATNTSDRVFAALLGTVGALVWPMSMIVYGVYWWTFGPSRVRVER